VTGYFTFEWIKLTRRWMPRIILLLLLSLTVLAFIAQTSRVGARANLLLPRAWLAALAYCSFFGPFFWPVIGGSWAGNEYGWGTIRSILTRRPQRITQAVSALMVLVAGVLIALIAIMVVATAASLVVAAATGNPSWSSGLFGGSFLTTMMKGLLTAWYISSFYLVLAYSAGVIARSAAVGIGFGIGSTLAEVVLSGIFGSLGGIWNDIAQHFPFQYSRNMITQVVHGQLAPGSNLARVEPGTPSASQSLIALALYAGVLIALMLLFVRSRDVTA
jgi:ABC-2 type transport system permease protein